MLVLHALSGTEMPEENEQEKKLTAAEEAAEMQGMVRKKTARKAEAEPGSDNKVVKLLEKNPLGMTLPEMAGGTRKLKRIRILRPMLAEAIKQGLVMPVSQRSGHTVYRLVKHIGSR
ncbi:MAG: hypothetical protein AB7W16_25860 [Candidatus Obscuribacterales bacterium]